jgi:hypothetical protein
MAIQQIRLLLEVAAVFQEQRAQAEVRSLGDGPSCRSSDHRAANLTGELPELKPGILSLRRIGSSVPQQHVRQLMGHHADDFGFGCCSAEHAPMHEHRPPGKREGVDLLEVHRREGILVHGVLEFCRGRYDQPVAEHREIFRHLLVLDDWVLLADFGNGLAADLDVLLRGVSILRQLDYGLSAHTCGRQARDHDQRSAAS